MTVGSASENGSGPRGAADAAGEGLADRGGPLIAVALLPDQQHQARRGAQSAPDIGERGDRVGEEHRSEPADAEVETRRWKAVNLGVRLLVGDVGQSLVVAELTGPFEHWRGEIDAYRASGDGGAGGLARGLACATADVEHTVARADAGSGAEEFVVQAQFRVVVEQVGHHRRRVPRYRLRPGRRRVRLAPGQAYRVVIRWQRPAMAVTND